MSPKTYKQFDNIREEKKSLIMDVALLLFANRGFHDTTIANIAKHAGISKGLIYTYFEGKENLLASIIERSVSEIYKYFDLNRDGYLTEDEFEFFIRKLGKALNEKQEFWRLIFQVLLQNEVRDQFLNSFLETESLVRSGKELKNGIFISNFMKILTEYFVRKTKSRGAEYDPYLELNMFLLTLKGFAVTYIYMDEDDDAYFDKTIERIITLYK
jgi:AcrR family transcriptional regulator